MRFEPTQLEGYTDISQVKGLPPRCPFAAPERCPRYFQSLALLRHTGATAMDPGRGERLKKAWEKSDAWPSVAEQETSVGGRPGRPDMFSHFCPEVAYLRFGLFASDFGGYPDELDIEFAHQSLSREGASRHDLRWTWAHAREIHYTECELYSPLVNDAGKSRPEATSEDIVELKPNVFGFGLNLNALWRHWGHWIRRCIGRV